MLQLNFHTTVGHLVQEASQLAFFALLAFCLGCSRNMPLIRDTTATAPSPGVTWTAPPAARRPLIQPEPTVPWAQVQYKSRPLTLPDIVDIALQNSPETMIAWANTRATAARYGASLAAWLPSLSVDGTIARTGEENSQTVAGISNSTSLAANLSYLLFDFGGRSAVVEQARQALYFSNWTNNAVIQNVVLNTEVAYYDYAGASAMLEANRTSLSDAEANLRAAEERHNVGLATNADVLQAQTAYSEGLLAVQNSQGQVRIARGALTMAMGYPATCSADFAQVIPEVPPDTLLQSVDRLVSQALASRPDLLAARAGAIMAAASVKQARSSLLPTLSVNGSAGRLWLRRSDSFTDNYGGNVSLQVPLFGGFSRQNNYLRAKAEADVAMAEARGKEQSVIFQVYSAYNDLQTAGIRIKTTSSLVNSAEQSEQVARGRYKEGIGSILDLLSAQRSLAFARAEQIQSRLGWHISLAQLAHNMGILGLHGDNPLTPGASQQR